MEKVSTTLGALTQAFQSQWKRSNVAEAKLENTLGHFTDLHKSLVLKDNITLKLQDTNDQLMQKVSITMKIIGGYPLGCPKRGKNFECWKFLSPTTNSCYLGQKHYRNVKII